MANLSRRKFIATLGVTAAGAIVVNGCSSGGGSDPDASSAPPAEETAAEAVIPSGADAPEVDTVKLGFIALTDSAPLIIAKEKGYFAKYGMPNVEVLKQASWATTRDNLVLGSAGGGIDGAHILTPMPYLISTGKVTDGKPLPMYILARLNTNGQGIQLSNTYKDLKIGLDAAPLKEPFAAKETNVAVTFPGGTHDLWMRYWLSAAGIDPDKDVSTIVVPPPQMVANVKTGTMDAFCVGEPWPLQTVNQDVGYGALTTGELWKDHPEKALGLRADWVDANPKAAKAMLMAVLDAQRWCDADENKEEMCTILAKREWFKVPFEDIIDRSKGSFNFGVRQLESQDLMMKYWRDNASYPYKSHDLWFLTEDVRWGYIDPTEDLQALIDKVNREDLWKEAAQALGVPAAEIPASTSRGVETFFDGVEFDPEDPAKYLAGLKIKKV